MRNQSDKNMTAQLARKIELGIIGFCLLSLVMIFQPFSQVLFGIGAVMVVTGGLLFNLVPQCHSGNSLANVIRTGVIVAIVFATVIVLALGSAKLYGIYFVG